MAQKPLELVCFRSVPGHIVARYGTGSASAAALPIGMEHGPDGPVWSRRIVAIPTSEVERYAKEYARALRSGALEQVPLEEFEGQEKADAELAKATAAKLAAEAEAPAERPAGAAVRAAIRAKSVTSQE